MPMPRSRLKSMLLFLAAAVLCSHQLCSCQVQAPVRLPPQPKPAAVTRPFALAPAPAAAPSDTLSTIAAAIRDNRPLGFRAPPVLQAPAPAVLADSQAADAPAVEAPGVVSAAVTAPAPAPVAPAAGPAAVPAPAAAAPQAAPGAAPAAKQPPPPPAATNCSSALALVLSSPRDFSLFGQLILASGLAPAIDESRLNGTLFTPTNAAINAFLKALNITQVELLAADPTLLANIAGYHIAGVPLTEAQLAALTPAQRIPTAVTDHFLSVSRAGGKLAIVPEVGKTANVIGAEIPACNGVVHIVDAVLVPDIATQPAASPAAAPAVEAAPVAAPAAA